jgi:hypothetical protein
VAIVSPVPEAGPPASEASGDAASKKSTLVEFFMQAPYPEVDLLPDRDYGTLRDLDL